MIRGDDYMDIIDTIHAASIFQTTCFPGEKLNRELEKTMSDKRGTIIKYRVARSKSDNAISTTSVTTVLKTVHVLRVPPKPRKNISTF